MVKKKKEIEEDEIDDFDEEEDDEEDDEEEEIAEQIKKKVKKKPKSSNEGVWEFINQQAFEGFRNKDTGEVLTSPDAIRKILNLLEEINERI